MQEQGTLPTQREPEAKSLHGPQMVRNAMGGYVYALDDIKRLERFIIMGCEGGSYFVMEEKLSKENVQALQRLIRDGKGTAAVELLRKVSVERRNVKQNPLIFALALCARSNDLDTKEAAYKVVNEVCRIPTHLFMFIKFCEQESEPNTGWGRAHKKAIQRWYKQFETKPDTLARLVTKYKNREGWNHKDVLRLAHPVPRDPAFGFILRWITKGYQEAYNRYIQNLHEAITPDNDVARIARLMKMYDDAVKCTNVDELCSMITEYKLTWEHLPTTMLNELKVWQTLLRYMPIEALIRNLGKMTSCGVFPENSEEEEIAVGKIRKINTEPDPVIDETDDGEPQPKRNVIHPFKILIGLVQYRHGRGDKGSLAWIPNKKILEALDNAFYQAFDKVEPTGKKYFLGVDVSGSMSQPVLGSNTLSCAMASAAMMMTCVRTEANHVIMGFSHRLVDLRIKTEDRLDVVMKKTQSLNFGATDCALPMIWAIENRDRDIDVFIIYTDNETWFGKVHPAQALRNYREYAQKPNAKLIVCGMCSNNFSIADPTDPGMLDIVGFDSAAPQLIADFAMDKL